ncbi:MAG: YraN family protein [Janthinobacterium lividum]
MSRAVGSIYETHALAYLCSQGMRLLERNVSSRCGELDLVMEDRDGTLVFVEVKARRSRAFGGALASVGARKQSRLLRAAGLYLLRRGGAAPPCRFDVVAFEAGRLCWIPDAFQLDAGAAGRYGTLR